MRALALVMILSSAASAQEIVVDLDALTRTLDQVVVLAAKRPQVLREAPASTSVITHADLEAYGWRDFNEALKSLAGFYGTHSGEFTYYGVRGVSFAGDANGRILFLVDGHPQQELWSHSFYPELAGLDASMIDHLEVLRGPASALYGSLGFLAIVNIVTRRGSEKEWARATFDMQDIHVFRGAASVSHRFKNDLEFGISASVNGGLGYEHRYSELASDMFCSTAIPKNCNRGISIRDTDKSFGAAVFAHLEYKGLSIRGSYQYLEKHIPFGPYRSLFNDTANRYVLGRGYLSIGYTVGRPDKAQVQMRASFDSATYADDLAYSSSTTVDDRYVYHDQANPYWLSTEAKLLLERAWANRLAFNFTLGGDFTFLNGNNKSGVIGMPAAADISRNILFGAAYAQAELAYAQKLFLTLGLRGDFSDIFPYEFSPRAALVLLPYKTGTFKLLYTHGFIRPSWYDAFFNDQISILDNPRLRPERADNYEIVYQQEIKDPVLLTTSLFYIRGDDLIRQAVVCVEDPMSMTASPDCPAGQSARTQQQNLASFQSIGAELGLVGKFRRGIRMYANYSYAHATLGDGSRPLNSPEHMAKAGVSIPAWRDHLVFAAEANVLSQRRFSEETTDESAPTWLLNAMVMWRGLPKGLNASFKVYNLVGITHEVPSTAEDSFPVRRIPLRGPTFVLRLSYSY